MYTPLICSTRRLHRLTDRLFSRTGAILCSGEDASFDLDPPPHLSRPAFPSPPLSSVLVGIRDFWVTFTAVCRVKSMSHVKEYKELYL